MYADGVSGISPRRQIANVYNLFGFAGAQNPNTVTANTTDATTPAMNIAGIDGAMIIELVKTGAGTCDIVIQGTLDQVPNASDTSQWLAMRFGVLGVAGTIAPVILTSLAGGGSTTWVSVYDAMPTMRVKVQNVAGAVGLTARVYLLPT